MRMRRTGTDIEKRREQRLDPPTESTGGASLGLDGLPVVGVPQ